MAWCPVCKNEYKEGYEVCSDCGAPLVDSLDDIDKLPEEDIHNHDNIKDLVTFAAGETLYDMDDENTFADLMDGRNDVFSEDGPADETRNITKHDVHFKPFVKASDRAEEYKSSAYALLLVGFAGIVFLVLSLLGIIPLSIAANIKTVGFIAMLIMFLIFIFVGIKSLVESKTISALSDIEDALSDSIRDYFKNNHTKETIDKEALSDDENSLTDELKFFKRAEAIGSLITKQFGPLEGAFLDNEVEKMYSLMFDE